MIHNLILKYLIFIIISFFILISPKVLRSESDYIFYPESKTKYDFTQNIGIGIVILPRSVFEDELSQIPILNYNARLDLPHNFILSGKLSTILFSNHLSTGILWNYKYHKFNLGAFTELGLWYGFFNSEGINLRSRGWTFFPGVAAAYNFDDVYLTMKFNLLYQSQATAVGDNKIGKTFNGYTGYSVSIASEQNFLDNSSISIEFKLNYTKFHNITWLSYSTFDNLIPYPELTFGIKL